MLVLWYFFNFGADTLYESLTIKYWQNPPGVDCQTVIKNYASDLPQLAYQETTIIDYVTSERNVTNMNDVVSRQGFETCFCNYMIREKN